MLTAAFAADSGVGGWQQTTQPCSVLVQDVTDLLQGCLAYCQGVVGQSIKSNSYRLIYSQATALLRDDGRDGAYKTLSE